MNFPSPYDLSGMKAFSERPDSRLKVELYLLRLELHSEIKKNRKRKKPTRRLKGWGG